MYDWQSAPYNAGAKGNAVSAKENIPDNPKTMVPSSAKGAPLATRLKPEPVLSKRQTASIPAVSVPAPAAVPLQPDPIMELNHMIGVSGNICGSVLWSADSSNIVFAAASTLVIMGVETHQQRFLLGHTAPISNITLLSFSPLLPPSHFRIMPQRR